jgi:hypothetical protein
VRLTGANRDDLIQRIEDGEFEVRRAEYWLPWDDVARLALDRWPLEVIYEALGDRAGEVLPDLLRLEDFTASIPAYVARFLELKAAQEKVTIGEYVVSMFAARSATLRRARAWDRARSSKRRSRASGRRCRSRVGRDE